jgi:hypothetical protein
LFTRRAQQPTLEIHGAEPRDGRIENPRDRHAIASTTEKATPFRSRRFIVNRWEG